MGMGVVIMQMILDCVPPHHEASKWQVIPGGIFTKGVTNIQEATHVVKTREPPFDSMPEELHGLTEVARRLLDKHVKNRPLANDVLSDPWFASASCVIA